MPTHSEPYQAKEKGYSETHRRAATATEARRRFPAYGGLRRLEAIQVFHRADCKGAAKISEKNLVRYNTRDEAIQAGKKPCHECNP